MPDQEYEDSYEPLTTEGEEETQNNMPDEWDGPHLMDCPFCGHPPCRWDIRDVLYPNNFYWRQHDGFRSYHHGDYRKEGDNAVWKMRCTDNHGGCGVEMLADSEQEVIDKWNTRVTKDKE